MCPGTPLTIPSPQSLTVTEWETCISFWFLFLMYTGIQVDGSRNIWICGPGGTAEGDDEALWGCDNTFIQEHDTRGAGKGVCKVGLVFQNEKPTTYVSC